MNILFVHSNFPGQFLNLAPYLAKQGHKIVFLTESENPQAIDLQGVVVCRFSDKFRDALAKSSTLQQKILLRAQYVDLAIRQLSGQGFNIDLMIAHGGKGYGLFPRGDHSAFKLLLYVEWFFTPNTSQHLFREFDFTTWSRCEIVNMPLLREMSLSDAIVCPSNWQKQQFPLEYRSKITVIFDGIDQQLFSEATPESRVCSLALKGTSGEDVLIQSDDVLLTYATRGMETLRGFPEFMRAVAYSMRHIPHLKVIIAGEDRQAYSYPPSSQMSSWKNFMLDELKDQLDLNRLFFTGLLPYVQLARLFQRSNLHCYFTRPYVVSWGFYQAVAANADLMVNQFPGLDEVVLDKTLLNIVNLDDQDSINSFTCQNLSTCQSADRQQLRLAEGLDLQTCLSNYAELVKSLGGKL